MIQRLLRGLHRAEDLLLAGLLGTLLLLALTQIGLRMFFETGLEWAETISRMGVLWLALMGALGAARAHRHIAIDALPRLFSPLWRRVAWATTQLATAILCGLLAWYGWGMLQMEREAPAVFVEGIASWWPMLAFPAGFGLLSLRFAVAAFAQPPEHEV
ncbi:MAG TPA: TRAP transporter small permease [Arenimonas sp.]|uniref:TRAP transporter small permease n=1 Tax=Arenimonas sp. TaxID=1872635 RepID=UPI002D148924|nr:TRAP transporter small permease [Arenimonas sp.]HMB56310.1 TRAP transporter small permease [Arenimonas sp.]